MNTTDVNGDARLPALSKGWVWVTIGEITQQIEKFDPSRIPDQEFAYLDISSIDNRTYKVAEPKRYRGSNAPSRARQLVKAHDVLFSTVRTYLRNIAQVPESSDGQVASTGFAVLRAEQGVLPQYIRHYWKVLGRIAYKYRIFHMSEYMISWYLLICAMENISHGIL
jgi:hypothetical protein